MENSSDIDDNDSKPREVSGHDTGNMMNENLTIVTTLRLGIQQINIFSVFLDSIQSMQPVAYYCNLNLRLLNQQTGKWYD